MDERAAHLLRCLSLREGTAERTNRVGRQNTVQIQSRPCRPADSNVSNSRRNPKSKLSCAVFALIRQLEI